MADLNEEALRAATEAVSDFFRLRGVAPRFRHDRVVTVAIKAFVEERLSKPVAHDPWCMFSAHYECCTTSMSRCDCLIGDRLLGDAEQAAGASSLRAHRKGQVNE